MTFIKTIIASAFALALSFGFSTTADAGDYMGYSPGCHGCSGSGHQPSQPSFSVDVDYVGFNAGAGLAKGNTLSPNGTVETFSMATDQSFVLFELDASGDFCGSNCTDGNWRLKAGQLTATENGALSIDKGHHKAGAATNVGSAIGGGFSFQGSFTGF